MRVNTLTEGNKNYELCKPNFETGGNKNQCFRHLIG
jgi:hypothetical protein